MVIAMGFLCGIIWGAFERMGFWLTLLYGIYGIIAFAAFSAVLLLWIYFDVNKEQ